MNNDSTTISLPAILRLADELEVLQRLPRTGFIMAGIPHPQTVAAHSYAVALWALLLLERLPDRHTLDRAKILLMCVLHEIAEARLGDNPQPARHLIGNASVSHAEALAADQILADMPPSWRAAWHEFEAGQSREARVVKAADKLELMHRVLMYERQHQGTLEQFWHWQENFRDADLPEATELFEELKRLRKVGAAP